MCRDVMKKKDSKQRKKSSYLKAHWNIRFLDLILHMDFHTFFVFIAHILRVVDRVLCLYLFHDMMHGANFVELIPLSRYRVLVFFL